MFSQPLKFANVICIESEVFQIKISYIVNKYVIILCKCNSTLNRTVEYICYLKSTSVCVQNRVLFAISSLIS